MQPLRTILSVMFAIFISAFSAQGAIDIGASTGITVLPSPPSDIRRRGLASDDTIHAFLELEDFVLPNDLAIDIGPLQAGTWPTETERYPLLPEPVPAGTRIKSYFLHVDSVTGRDDDGVFFDGTIAFSPDTRILGIILRANPLDNFDTLVESLFPGRTIYPNGTNRILEFLTGDDFVRAHDAITFDPVTKTISMHLANGDSVDQFRIITAVPETSSFLMAAIAASLIAAYRLHRTLRSDGPRSSAPFYVQISPSRRKSATTTPVTSCITSGS